MKEKGLRKISQHLKRASELVIQSNQEFVRAKKNLAEIKE